MAKTMNTKTITIISVVILVAAGLGAGIVFLTMRSDEGYAVDTELQVFGNANGDWKLDDDDVIFLKEIIAGEREETYYADANQDGVVDQSDVLQVENVIDRTADYLWLVDGDGHVKKISLNIERIGAEYYSNTELMCILQLQDKVVAIDNAPYQTKDFYFGEEKGKDIINMINMNDPNYEFVADLDLDILLTFSYAGTEAKQEKLQDVDVIYLGLYRPDVLEPEKSEYVQGILKAGYIFDKVDRAEAYVEWLLEIRDGIESISKNIAEEDKVKVLMTNYSNSYFSDETVSTWSIYTKIDPQVQALLLAGGHPVAMDILEEYQYNGGLDRTSYGVKVGHEPILDAEIDYIFCHCVRYTYGGAVVTSTPIHGYESGDSTEMNQAHDLAVSRAITNFVEGDNIYIMAGDFRNGATGGILHAAYIAKVIYPDLFVDMDPIAIHNEYVNNWLNIPEYDVSTDGVFISPAIQ